MAKKPRKPRKPPVPLSPGSARPFGNDGVEIVLAGEPLPQSRPRVTTQGVFSSDSPELRAWRRSLTAAAMDMRPRVVLPAGPILVVLALGMPTSDQSRWGEVSTVRPDVDNLAKGLLDALQHSARDRKAAGDAFVQELPLDDDGRIAGLLIVKAHCPAPGFARMRLEIAPSGRRSVLRSMRRLADLAGDPSLFAWPADLIARRVQGRT